MIIITFLGRRRGVNCQIVRITVRFPDNRNVCIIFHYKTRLLQDYSIIRQPTEQSGISLDTLDSTDENHEIVSSEWAPSLCEFRRAFPTGSLAKEEAPDCVSRRRSLPYTLPLPALVPSQLHSYLLHLLARVRRQRLSAQNPRCIFNHPTLVYASRPRSVSSYCLLSLGNWLQLQDRLTPRSVTLLRLIIDFPALLPNDNYKKHIW